MQRTLKLIDLKIGEKLKKARARKGWSQQRLAKEAGTSYNLITKIEQGWTKEPTIQSITKICNAFDMSIEKFLGL